ncbi:hypothetical protein K438DRAFT_1981187 [Mycena galopus ATCC 62051]|nr:hypothetical protein K438DRAFT_1981187 [Mycena galopus ATCC 62051]
MGYNGASAIATLVPVCPRSASALANLPSDSPECRQGDHPGGLSAGDDLEHVDVSVHLFHTDLWTCCRSGYVPSHSAVSVKKPRQRWQASAIPFGAPFLRRPNFVRMTRRETRILKRWRIPLLTVPDVPTFTTPIDMQDFYWRSGHLRLEHKWQRPPSAGPRRPLPSVLCKAAARHFSVHCRLELHRGPIARSDPGILPSARGIRTADPVTEVPRRRRGMDFGLPYDHDDEVSDLRRTLRRVADTRRAQRAALNATALPEAGSHTTATSSPRRGDRATPSARGAWHLSLHHHHHVPTTASITVVWKPSRLSSLLSSFPSPLTPLWLDSGIRHPEASRTSKYGTSLCDRPALPGARRAWKASCFLETRHDRRSEGPRRYDSADGTSMTHGSAIHSPCVDGSSPCATASLGAGRVTTRALTNRTHSRRARLLRAGVMRPQRRLLACMQRASQHLASCRVTAWDRVKLSLCGTD